MRKGFKVICDILEMFGAIVLGIKAALMMGESASVWSYLIIADMFVLAVIFAWDVGRDIAKGLIELAEK